MQLLAALANARERLAQAGVSSPDADADWLMCHVLEISRAELAGQKFAGDRSLSLEQVQKFETALSRRQAREPLQHITGLAAFRYLELEVGPGVFIPRPETESLVQLGIDFLRKLDPGARVADLGTGSGAIAISLATEVAGSQVFAVELSADAAAYAARNIAKYAPAVELRIGELQSALNDLAGTLDAVVTNPPYIPLTAVPIDQEVRDYDPALALYGGDDGLEIIRDIVGIAAGLVRIGGLLAIEHADGQSEAVCELLLSAGWSCVSAHADPTGRKRTVSAIR